MRALAPSVPILAPLVGYQPGDSAARSKYRQSTEPWLGWYQSKRWRRLRWQVLTDALFTCTECKRVVVPTSQCIADHIVPHKGKVSLFWDRSNLQCLCKPCHDGVKQRRDHRL